MPCQPMPRPTHIAGADAELLRLAILGCLLYRRQLPSWISGVPGHPPPGPCRFQTARACLPLERCRVGLPASS